MFRIFAPKKVFSSFFQSCLSAEIFPPNVHFGLAEGLLCPASSPPAVVSPPAEGRDEGQLVSLILYFRCEIIHFLVVSSYYRRAPSEHVRAPVDLERRMMALPSVSSQDQDERVRVPGQGLQLGRSRVVAGLCFLKACMSFRLPFHGGFWREKLTKNTYHLRTSILLTRSWTSLRPVRSTRFLLQEVAASEPPPLLTKTGLPSRSGIMDHLSSLDSGLVWTATQSPTPGRRSLKGKESLYRNRQVLLSPLNQFDG